MRNVYTFAGLTFALALAFSLTTAAQTSSTESKPQASPDQSQTDSAGNRLRDRVSSRGVHALKPTLHRWPVPSAPRTELFNFLESCG